MKKLFSILLVVLGIFILGSCQQPLEVTGSVSVNTNAAKAAPALNGKEIIAYFCDWSIYAGHDQYRVSKIPFEKLTIINFSFLSIVDDVHTLFDGFKDYTQTTFNRTVQKYEAAWLDKNADIDQTFGDPSIPWGSEYAGCLGQFKYYKEQYPHLKVVPSIGGWTKGHMFSEMAANPAYRKIFVDSTVTLAREYGFDGVDIDWEYPGISREPDTRDEYDWGCPGQPADTQNFTILMKELREAFDAASIVDNKDYLVTAAMGIGYDKFALTEIDKYPQYLDYINLMTYDMHGAWDSFTGHQAPIHVDPSAPYDADIRDKYNVDYAIQQFLDAGVPASKLTLGMPFYTRGWNGVPAGPNAALPGLYQTAGGSPVGRWDNPNVPGGQGPYFEVKNKIDAGTLSVYVDPVSEASYAYGSNGEFYTFDTAEIIKKKSQIVKNLGLGGAMIWEIDGDTWQDGSYELTNTIYNELSTGIVTPTPTVTSEIPQFDIYKARTNPVQNVTSTSAYVSGYSELIQKGQQSADLSIKIEYWRADDPGNKIIAVEKPFVYGGPMNADATITGLIPNTIYVYQYSSMPGGLGDAVSFTTLSTDPTPTATATIPTCPLPEYVDGNVYTGGMEVHYNGYDWKAKWWTQNEAPSNSGSGVWENLGECGTVVVTPTPTTTVGPVSYTVNISVLNNSVGVDMKIDNELITHLLPSMEIFREGTTHDLSFTVLDPNAQFLYWQDGTTTLNRTITVNEAMNLVAVFATATPTVTPTITITPTPTAEPIIINPVTNDATDITDTSAVISGAANYVSGVDYGLELRYWRADDPGNVIVAATAFKYYGTISLATELTGLEPGITYEFEFVSMPGGSGGVKSFTTTSPVAPWDAAAVYNAGDVVSHGGSNWKAQWWTTGEEPGTTGEWGVWRIQ